MTNGERDDWGRIGLGVGPADRARAEAGVRAAYWQAGLPAPGTVVWFASPVTAAAAALLLTGGAAQVFADGLERETEQFFEAARSALAAQGLRAPGADECPGVREAVWTAPWEAARGRLQAELGQAAWSERWTLTSGALWPRLHGLAQRLQQAVVDALGGPEDAERPAERVHARAAVRRALREAVLGQHDAAWLAALAEDPLLDGLASVACSAGWWWPFADVVLLTERPVLLRQDEAGRLHSGEGAAVAFGDGFALHAWRGMPVPAELFRRLGEVTAEQIREQPNAELRRVMLEFYGYERFLAESGAEPVHRDDSGALWRIELEQDEPVVMVEVVNATPEPDGTHRVYWLRVPPSTRTAREGVAWTFGLPAQAYQPLRQT
ncbi:DUF6745 domain-containing protein [Streptacidiphilus rugosus]|uniref:DUF6745 domain-containing protein n=1 Tax=Streptacidiphilus rugosus TaxID=405783 RepID=UPI0005612427|nr:hypothetical protein [Streptacidiphilus rugosus]